MKPHSCKGRSTRPCVADYVYNWICPTTYSFLPQLEMANVHWDNNSSALCHNMRIPPKSAELLRSPESQKYKSIAAICVCRCMATCQDLCYKTWVGHDFRIFPQNMVWLSGLLGVPCTRPLTCTFSEHICPAQNTQSCQHIRYSSLELPLYGGFPWVSPLDKWTKNIETITSSNSRS